MSRKLGYTWYPKDFISDPDVMFMTAAERGVFRDLLDLAYTNENEIKHNAEMLARYTNSDVETVEKILELKCEKTPTGWRVPSVEKRLEIAETNRKNGAKGGRPRLAKKPKENPNTNPSVSESETQHERQREREREREIEREEESECEIKRKPPTQNFSKSFGKKPIDELKKICGGHQTWIENIAMKNSITPSDVKLWFEAFCLHLGAIGKTEETEQEFKRYCASWIASEIRQGRKPLNDVKAPKEKTTATDAMQQALIKKYGNHVGNS